MQITTDMIAAAWIGWKEYSSKNKNALGEDLMRAALEAALGAKSSRSLPTLRCIVTGHIVGTDTRMIGKPCECPTCIAADCIEDLARVIRRMMTDASFIAVDEGRVTLERWGLK